MTNPLSTGSTSTGSKVLAPTMVYKTIMEAVRKGLVFRNLAATIIPPAQIPGSAIKVSLQDVDSITVHAVAEGAEIPYDHESYTQRTLTPVKYGVNVGITREMIEDSQFAVALLNAGSAGYALADKEDSLVVSELSSASTAAGHDVANGNATLPITDITEAIQNLENDGYTATHMVIGVEIANDIRNLDTFTEADKSGINDPGRSLIGTIFGMNVVVSRNVSAKLAYVIDANKAFAIAEKRPVTLENYDDHSRDMRHVVVTMRIAAGYLFAESVSEITTT
jgi:HK97 family phage major capsid protein